MPEPTDSGEAIYVDVESLPDSNRGVRVQSAALPFGQGDVV